MNILIAGKEDSLQVETVEMLGQLGHTCYDVRDRDEVFSSCQNKKLDIIMIHASFILAHGSKSINEIRNLNKSLYTLIVLVCIQENTELLSSVEHCDLDDIMRFPIELEVFRIKINSYAKSILHYRNTAEQNNRYLLLLREQTNELKVADHVYSAIIKSAQIKLPGMKSLNQPASLLSGDTLFTSVSPTGSTMIMLADFTGHGLSAAIVALPSSEIFYGMVNKGYCISDIVTELNKKLYRLLPRDMYCAAILVEITEICDHISIWNGGLPEAYLLDENSIINATIESFQPPLGVMATDKFDAQTRIINCQPKDKLIFHTDGIMSAINSQGVKISRDIIKQCIAASKKHSPFDNISLVLAQFIKQTVQRDDITVVEYILSKSNHCYDENSENEDIIPTTWSFNTQLRHDVLSAFNPVPIILNQIMEYAHLTPYKEKLFTVLSELYNNALDHGILKLDSKLKNSAEGFSTFYTRREELLNNLKAGCITIDVSHSPQIEGGKLTLKVSDSGDGFDFKLIEHQKIDSNEPKLHGRGVLLISQICDSVVYSSNGSCVEITFSWSNRDKLARKNNAA